MKTLCLVAWLLAVSAMATPELAVPFRADFTGATLHAGRKEVHSRRVLNAGDYAVLAEGLLVTARDGGLVALRLRDGKEAWTAQAPGGMFPEIVAHRLGLGFVRLWRKQKRNGYDDYTLDPSAKVHRVSFDDGHWLSPLSAGTSLLKKDVQILDVLASSNGVFVMDCVPGESDLHEQQIKSYRISGFLTDSSAPSWRKEFKSAGTVPSFGAGLLFQGDRLYAKSEVRHLSVIGSTLIVCAGGVQDILALDTASGSEKWRLPAIWEYKRGFIGPSVWQHFVARFGVHQLSEGTATRNRMEEMRKDLARRCRIVGGPIVLPTPEALQSAHYACSNCGKYHGKPPSEQYRLFVAVSEGEGDFAGYLSECSIYEITDEGTPIALVKMPRMVLGSDCFAGDDAAIWRCEHGAVAELRPSRQSGGLSEGGHGTDCIANLARFMQPSDALNAEDVDGNSTTNWLTWARASDPACLSRDVIYRLSGDPYIRKQDEALIHFPLARVSLLSGALSELILSVPFVGKVQLPAENYSSSGDSAFSYCPLYLSVFDLQTHKGQLAITISAQDGEKTILLFPESEILNASDSRENP